MFVGSNDLADLVPDRTRIDFNMVVNVRQLPQQCLGNFAVGRDDDFARFGIDHVQRNFFAEQNV